MTSLQRKSSWFRRMIGSLGLLLNIGVMCWALLCFAAGYISGEDHPYLQIITLSTPFALAANIFFVFFWLLARRKWRIILPAFTLAVCHKLLLASFGWHVFTSQDLRAAPDRVKVMTWNVHGMGIFSNNQRNTVDRRVMDVIHAESPDILVLPEFYTLYNNALKPYATRIMEQNGYHEYRFQYDNTYGTRVYFGTAIFSRFPILAFKGTKLGRFVYAVQADVELSKGKIVRLVCVHLQSFRLGDKDKTLISGARKNAAPALSKGPKFLRKFAAAYALRARQADSVAFVMSQSPYPLLVCGDFNDLPGSYVYNTIKGQLRDAHRQHGRGFGRTYNLFSPTLRIDYILYDPKMFAIKGVKTRQTNLSDHNPVVATFQLKK